jgi:hypothetical protein
MRKQPWNGSTVTERPRAFYTVPRGLASGEGKPEGSAASARTTQIGMVLTGCELLLPPVKPETVPADQHPVPA